MSEPQPSRRRTPERRSLVIAVVALFGAVVALGPTERFEEGWSEPDLPADLDAWLTEQEAVVPNLRQGDQKEIVWADPAAPGKTAFALVYLHGFSADRHEMEPVVSDLARGVGANVFFTRLTGHGRDGAAMADATVEGWLDDTAEAIAIGERIGERVVVIGTSTGGTLAAWAAARPESAGRIDGLVLVSPNFQPKDRTSRVFLYPWGGQLARLIVGAERCFTAENDEQERHWTTCYPTSVIRTMMALVERVRTMDLSRIGVPTLVLYSPDDQVVEPEETLRVIAGMSGTEPTLYEVRTSDDPANHVLAGEIVSPASTDEVGTLLRTFFEALSGDGGPR